MKSFQFVSLAILTQVVLLLNQIVLLPIQIRIWGTDSTAYWYSTLAFAAVTTAADFGLRTAGHADLIRYWHDRDDLQAKTNFQHMWAWIRILITLATVLLVILDFGYNHLLKGAVYPLWRPALVIGIALETLLIIRVVYLDSLGLYREAEAGYLLLAAARFFLAAGALVFFHSPPETLAWIWFFTGVFAIAHQGRLCGRLGLLRLFERMPPDMSWETLAIARHTMADPCSSWVRINLPVLVLASIAQPVAITTYVALRAVFGAARTTIQQLSRYASVEFVSLRHARKFELAETHLTLCIMLAAFAASALTCFVVADNFRLAALWLVKADMRLYQVIAITFGFGSAFYSYQVMLAVMLRSGEVDRIASRQYLYIFIAAIFAAVALAARSTVLWLVLMLAADIMISITFMLKTSPGGIQTQTSAGRRGCVAATASSIVALAMWLVVRFGDFAFMHEKGMAAFVGTAGFVLLWMSMIAAVYLALIYHLFARIKNTMGTLLGTLPGFRTEAAK